MSPKTATRIPRGKLVTSLAFTIVVGAVLRSGRLPLLVGWSQPGGSSHGVREAIDAGACNFAPRPCGAGAAHAFRRREFVTTGGLLSTVEGCAGWSGVASALQPSAKGGERVTLNNGLSFPIASFGLQEYGDSTAERLTQMTIGVGYRNFFSSVLGNNQKGFARGFAASGVPRDEVFICGSVVSNEAKGFDAAYAQTKQGCGENLKAFAVGGITYLDMIMLDYPGGDCDSIRGQWKAFEEMLADGQTKSLAVSNFSPEQLDCILTDKSATVPAVNQLGFPVGGGDVKFVEENKKRGILVQAWSPLGTLHPSQPYKPSAVVKSACDAIGQAHGKSAEQVALRWLVQLGATFTTQSKVEEHFREDIDVFDFALTDLEMNKLSSLKVRISV